MPLRPTKEQSGFELTLERPTVVDRIRIGGLPAPFLKRATLEGSGDREHWTMLAAEATVFDLPDERLTQTEVPFTPGEFRYLRVTWNDRNSGVVPLPGFVDAREATGPPEPAPLRVPLQLQRRGSEPGRTRYRIDPAGGELAARRARDRGGRSEHPAVRARQRAAPVG